MKTQIGIVGTESMGPLVIIRMTSARAVQETRSFRGTRTHKVVQNPCQPRDRHRNHLACESERVPGYGHQHGYQCPHHRMVLRESSELIVVQQRWLSRKEGIL